MNKALVENAQNEVDGKDRHGNQEKHVRGRILIRLSGALESGVNGVGYVKFAPGRFNMVDGRAQRGSGSEVEREGNRRENSLVIHRKRGVGRLVMSKRAE